MAWRSVRDRFRQIGIPTAELDARLLAEAAFGLGRLELVNREREQVSEDGLARLQRFAERRLGGEPVERILGEKEFWGLPFGLNAATLIPRPETEMLVERGLQELAAIKGPRMLDLGTGTGCIPIALLSERPDLTAVAVDISAEALAMARENAGRHGVANRFDGRQGSWFSALRPGERFDLITSNPPYIETPAIAGLMSEVQHHDPRLALDGGADGLDAYRAIAAGVDGWLEPDGVLLLEIGSSQAGSVRDILLHAGFGSIAVERDLAGLDRMIVACRN